MQENSPAEGVSVERVDVAALNAMSGETLLEFALDTFGVRAAIGTSLQKTGIILIDLAARLNRPFRVFFIDTRLNPPETYTLLAEVQERYGIAIERFEPTTQELDQLHREVGSYAHFLSRSRCCYARKVLPMHRAEDTLDVWIAGVRAGQSDHRRDHAAKAELTRTHDNRPMLKLNPLIDWSDEQVDAYVADHRLPKHPFYDYVSPYGERYFVIGCQPCHIPVQESQGRRAGKFPWEQGKKECGLHQHGSGI
jgi:phosphoadenosine phosphosulfate reductase